MSNKISILPQEVVSKIAAGEVVERPASIVKELIENSIDADADSIEIEVDSGGMSLIRVADNGIGMTEKDAVLACTPHATSKIKDINDLDRIDTLGFRGEALASIAAVSQLDLTTRAESEDVGIYLYLESGQILKKKPAGRSGGTTIEVRNLFYNVPARKKFIKKEGVELTEIVNVVGRYIISHPLIEIKLIQRDRTILHAARDMKPLERIQLVLGGDICKNMIELDGFGDKYKVEGFVSQPAATRKDRRGQIFFVNKRFFRNRLMNDAVYAAYKSLLERGRYPASILFLSVGPGDIDVNVHPAKLEVKFKEEQVLKDTIIEAIKNGFERVKEQDAKKKEFISLARKTESPLSAIIKEDTSFILPELQEEFSYDFQEKRQREKGGIEAPLSFDNIFQIGAAYIVQVNLDGITVTDQHAAHERILYEIFSEAFKKGAIEVQNLLFPVRLDSSLSETIIINKTRDTFKLLGFNIEPFGDNTFLVHSVPAILKDKDIKTVIMDVLTDFSSYNNLAKAEALDEFVKLMSCHAAIRAGDLLNREEMVALLKQLDRCSLPFTCPHGRPTSLAITMEELEKRFHRK